MENDASTNPVNIQFKVKDPTLRDRRDNLAKARGITNEELFEVMVKTLEAEDFSSAHASHAAALAAFDAKAAEMRTIVAGVVETCDTAAAAADADAQGKVDAMQERLNRALERADEAEAALAEAEDAIAERERLEEEVAALNERAADAEAALSAARSQIADASDAREAALKSELAMKEAQAEQDRLTADLRDLMAHTDAEGALAAERLARAEDAASEARATQMREDMDRVRAEREEMRDRLAEAQAANGQLEVAASAAQARADELEKRVELLERLVSAKGQADGE